MKKLLYIIGLFVLAFSACDPLEDIYSELDDAKVPYNESIEYILTADDYSMISSAAESMQKA